MGKLEKVISKRTDVDNSGPVDEKEIKKSEAELGLRFSKEYSEYLESYGQISIEGHEFTGLKCAKYLNVVQATKEEWGLDAEISREWYVVEQAGIDGIVIWQDSKGNLHQSSPSTKAFKLADSFADYIASRE